MAEIAEVMIYKHGPTGEGRRILALMEVYGYESVTAFARALGVSQPRVSNVTGSGLPLSKELAIAIRREIPAVTLDFLFFGDPHCLKSIELERKLREYERRNHVRLFNTDD